MSVLLERLNIPTGNPVTINIYKDGTWVNAYTTEDGKAVNVPPHGDLIDRREVERYALPRTEMVDGEIVQNKYVYLQTIQQLPTIIPAEEGE